MPTALVVGGGGFIGRAVVAALQAARMGRGADLEVVVLDRLADAGDPTRVVVDLTTPGAERDLEAALATLRPEVVVNAAGATEGSAAVLVASNVLATAVLLDVLARVGQRLRYIHVGSAAEYGPGPRDVPVVEGTRGQPVSAYGVTKLAATDLVLLARASRLEATVVRPFNVVGPAMRTSTLPGSAARRLADAIAGGSPRVEFGRLDAVRDFIDVSDIGRAIARAAIAPRLGEPIVNLGSGEGHTARDLVEAMADSLGFDGEIVETEAASPRSGGVDWQVADVRLARASLDWRPRLSFSEAAARAVGQSGIGSSVAYRSGTRQ